MSVSRDGVLRYYHLGKNQDAKMQLDLTSYQVESIRFIYVGKHSAAKATNGQ